MEHELEKVLDGDMREDLSDAALGQASVRGAAVDIVIAAVYERTTKYDRIDSIAHFTVKKD